MTKIFKTRSNNRVVIDSASEKVDRCRSSSFSMNLSLSGQESYFIGSRELSIIPGHFLLLNQGTSYTRIIDSMQPVKTFSVSFDPKFLADFSKSLFRSDGHLLDDPFGETTETFNFPEAIYPCVNDFKYNILNLKKSLEAGISDELLINHYLHHCLFNFYKIYRQEVVHKVRRLDFLHRGTRAEILKRLLVARDYIISNYNQKVRMEDLAGAAGLSVNHLLRTFKQAYGTSPYQFLLNFRIEQSKHLLATTDYPVGEIAIILGFDSSKTYIKFFKKENLITPLKFRAKLKREGFRH